MHISSAAYWSSLSGEPGMGCPQQDITAKLSSCDRHLNRYKSHVRGHVTTVACVFASFFLQSTISSLVLLTFSSSLCTTLQDCWCPVFGCFFYMWLCFPNFAVRFCIWLCFPYFATWFRIWLCFLFFELGYVFCFCSKFMYLFVFSIFGCVSVFGYNFFAWLCFLVLQRFCIWLHFLFLQRVYVFGTIQYTCDMNVSVNSWMSICVK